MATSTCPKCASTSFELKVHTPKYSVKEFQFLQCSSCGAVVGAFELFSVNRDLQLIKDKLGIG